MAGRPADEPDNPRPFGRRAAWIAVSATDSQQVAETLGLRTVLPANWSDGLDAAAREGVFVAPPIDGVVLAVGADLHGDGDYARIVPPLLEHLSATFGRAAWFLSHDEAEHHGWGLAQDGELLRAYAWTEEDGELLSHGEPTDAERLLGCFVDDPRDRSDAPGWWPDEAVVMRVAGEWAIDPSRLGRRELPPSCGLLGRL